jgi:thioredoxin-like negative regulator of GroEL
LVPPDLILLDQFNFHHRLAATRGVALVFFTSADCGSCRLWKRLLGQYRGHGGDFSVYEVDAQRDMALTREFEVFHLPALFLYRDGHYHGPLQCEAQAAALTRAIEAALAAPAQELP